MIGSPEILIGTLFPFPGFDVTVDETDVCLVIMADLPAVIHSNWLERIGLQQNEGF